MTIASTAGALVCVRLLGWLESRFAWENTHGALALLVTVSAVGFPLILLLSKMLGVNEIDDLLEEAGVLETATPRCCVELKMLGAS